MLFNPVQSNDTKAVYMLLSAPHKSSENEPSDPYSVVMLCAIQK